MQTFEQIRVHATTHYKVRTNDRYMVGIEMTLEQGTRHQGIFLSEIEGDDGRKYLRVSTAIAPMMGVDAKRALSFNWEQRVGYLAVSELDGSPYLQLCENRPFTGLTAAEIDRVVIEIGGLGDRIERAFSAGGDLF